MNENEIDRIAAAANCLRPDWPLASLRTLLNKPEIAKRPRRDVAVALAWVACEAASKTPARVLEAGPWWTATNAEGGVPRVHWLDRCHVCNTSEASCKRVNPTDHAFVSNGDYHAGKVRPEIGTPMPDEIRHALKRMSADHSKPEPTDPTATPNGDPR